MPRRWRDAEISVYAYADKETKPLLWWENFPREPVGVEPRTTGTNCGTYERLILEREIGTAK